ncbi:2-oxoacid:acceptor oxidoreductase family protein, partial [Candidatus Bathyarchaeota archaeon]|nr:2-oxoacid:acceptor oxidoreductase family protein [Candidatus Bathyarchaeota archaeon]
MPKRIEVRISGLGGQGVVLAGEILGRAAAYEGKRVVQTQSYGAEARGSAAKSEVIISDSEIGFPKVRKCDVLVAMSQSAVEMHLKDLKEKGVLIVDEDLVKHLPETKARVFRIPATKTAEKL